MNKPLLSLLFAGLLMSGCDRSTSAQHTPEAIDTASVSALNNVLAKYDPAPQTFTTASSKPSTITGRQGTMIQIDPEDLVTESSRPMGENITVQLKELTNIYALLASNARTISDSQLLVSGGAYFIGMTSGGEKLKLRKGKTLQVAFPRITDKPMKLFYGQRNELGQMNWTAAGMKFSKPSAPAKPIAAKTHAAVRSDMNALDDYIKAESGDTTAEIFSEAERQQYRMKARAERQVYNAIQLQQLGWINCDRFLEIPGDEKTDLSVDAPAAEGFKAVNLLLVFKGLNSVNQGYYYFNKTPVFTGLPLGFKVRLIAYAVKDQKLFSFNADMAVTKGQTVKLILKETTDKALKKLLEK